MGVAMLPARAPRRAKRSPRHAAELGSVRALVNSAGIATSVPATRESPEQFRKVIEVNLNDTYWMCQGIARVMSQSGTIVKVSSVRGLVSTGLPRRLIPRRRPACSA